MKEKESASGPTQTFSSLLGQAVIDRWGDLPRIIQEQLFEAAVAAGSHATGAGRLRERLAIFLHEHHPRTEAGAASAPRINDAAGQDGILA